MKSVPTRLFDGDVSVGRNVATGGDVLIEGSCNIKHDIKVEGSLEARSIKGLNKILFGNLPLRMEVDTGGDGAMAWGETLRVVCRVYQGFEDVTGQITRWSVTRDTGVPGDDAVWALKPKVKQFGGEIDLVLTAEENDLGRPLNGITTLFTFKAEIDGVTEAAIMELAVG